MRNSTKIRLLLQQGDRRTVGHVDEVVRLVLREPKLVPTLVQCTLEADEGTRMRAADALEKVSREQVEELQPYTSAVIGLFEENEQQELRWHLAVILPRLRLDASERRRTSRVLQQCLAAKSSIVRTFALQGLTDLTAQSPAITPMVLELLQSAQRDGTPAMRARSRRLLSLLERRAAKLDQPLGSTDKPSSKKRGR